MPRLVRRRLAYSRNFSSNEPSSSTASIKVTLQQQIEHGWQKAGTLVPLGSLLHMHQIQVGSDSLLLVYTFTCI